MPSNVIDTALSELKPDDLRQQIRLNKFSNNTSGFAQGFVQGNIVILPKDWAADFLQFCQFNPKPCPLIGMSVIEGDYSLPELGENIDIRTDVPGYRLFIEGILKEELSDITHLWREDLVTFVLGCSFSFEEALSSLKYISTSII